MATEIIYKEEEKRVFVFPDRDLSEAAREAAALLAKDKILKTRPIVNFKFDPMCGGAVEGTLYYRSGWVGEWL